MRQGPNNGRRPRSRHHSGHNNGGHGSHPSGNGGNGNSVANQGTGNRPRSASSLRHQTFDSNCIDVRVRGNAWQVFEKYQALARDATSSGDRVAAENFLQHAEHYYRIIEAINEATAAEQRQRGTPPFGQQPDVPPNYYGGTTPQNPNDASGTPPGAPSTQAEVETRAPSPFFTAEEAEEGEPSEPLVAQR